MGKQEFLSTLRFCLEGKLNPAQIAEHLRYYEEYINSEMRSGMDEAQAVAGLGDARFIAKSIVASSTGDESYSNAYDEEYSDGAEERGDFADRAKQSFKNLVPILILIGVIMVVVLLVGFLFNILGILFPVLLPIFIIWFLLTLFRSR